MSVERCRLALGMPQSVAFQRSMETSLHGLRMGYAVPTLTIKWSTRKILIVVLIITTKSYFSKNTQPHRVLVLGFCSSSLVAGLFVCVRVWVHGWVCSLYYDRSPQNVPRHFPFGTPDKTSVQSDYIYRHHQHLRGTLPYSNLCSHPLNIPSSSVRMHHSCMGHFSEIH